MNKNTKKELLQYGIIALIAVFLYATGLHTQVISYFQRAILATGLIRPNTEQVAENPADALPQPNLNIELMDATGKLLNMQQFQGKVLFINLWATWCPPCLAEMPYIDQLYRDLKQEDLVFLMISVDEDFSKAKAYTTSQEFGFPIYQLAGKWPAMLDASTIPSTFVIDRMGRLVVQHHGMAKYNTNDFKAFLQGLL